MTKTEVHQLAIGMIANLLLAKTGQTLSPDRHWRIDTALDTVLRHRGIRTSEDLLILLTEPDDSSIKQELVEALLNNETYFFRDRQVLEQLAEEVFPVLERNNAHSRKIRIWSAGCSTGQEPLTLAMMFLEQGSRWSGWDIDILATDVSTSAITRAREGIYSNFEIQRGLAVGQMLSHFDEVSQGWAPAARLRRMITFEQGNILDAPPARRGFDLVLCRNLLLYLDGDKRRIACQNLQSAMAPHAYLLLGGGETIFEYSKKLRPTANGGGLYRLVGEASGQSDQRAAAFEQPRARPQPA